MKRTFLKITFLLILLMTIIATTVIYANTTSSGMACTLLSTERGGIVSEGRRAMTNAKETYDSFGYSTNSLENPSPLLILSNAASSKVQLYCCHGNPSVLEFPSGGLTVGNSFVSSGKEFNSINGVNWTNAKLVTLAACNTAGYGSSQTGSLAHQIMSKGAQMTIGWYTEVNPYSMPDWLDNFHTELDNGYDPLAAINRASNNYSYFNPNVRNASFWYNSISTLSDDNFELMANTDINSSNAVVSDKNILSINEMGNMEIAQVENKIKEINPNFNVEDYEKTYTEGLYVFNNNTKEMKHMNSYINYKLKIGDFITNYEYSVIIDGNGKVQQIVDFTDKDYSYSQLNNMKNSPTNTVTANDTNVYLQRARENIQNQEDILEEEIDFFYDLENNKKLAIVTLRIKDDILGDKLETYTYNINNSIY